MTDSASSSPRSEECRPASEARTRPHARPNFDTLSQWARQITLGAEKPDDLSPMESASWDRLAAEVEEMRDSGIVIDIPSD